MSYEEYKTGSEQSNEKEFLRQPPTAYLEASARHTIEEVEALPEGTRAELIDGVLYFMATPSRPHQRMVADLHFAIESYIRRHGGSCEVNISPFAVYLNNDSSIYLEPDLVVVCDPSKLDDKGCHGAPDWVIEVVSPSSHMLDHHIKLSKYRTAGVQEYWIIDVKQRKVDIYLFSAEKDTGKSRESVHTYSFDDEINCHVCRGLILRLADLKSL